MMMASVERHPQQGGTRVGLEPPSTSRTYISQDFLSPLSYSRSVSPTRTPFSNHHLHQQPSTNKRSVPPPPASIQKSALVDGMAQLSPFTLANDAEMSRLLSLSGGGTPRSILSNQSSSTERMKKELQEVFQYIDGVNFVTPYKDGATGRSMPVTPFATMTSNAKPPRPVSSVLVDRSNTLPVREQRAPTSAWKQAQPKTTSARDPTPTKPKAIGLDLLRENPSAAAEFFSTTSSSYFQSFPSTPSPVNQSSLIVELSQATTAPEEDDHVENQENGYPDPPMEDSKFLQDDWASPQRRRVPLEPEPTHNESQPKQGETSILLGTAFTDCDLRPRPDSGRPRRIQTRWATPLYEHSEESDASNQYHEEEEPYFATMIEDIAAGAIASLNLPISPGELTGSADAEESKLDELSRRWPETPRDAKEWLQTAVTALQDARTERDAARKWARDMREAVEKWAEEQRKLIRCETTTRMDVLEEREQQVRFQTQALANLEALVQQLHLDFQSTQTQRQASESQLQKLILDQQDRIHSLSQQLASMENAVSEGFSQGQKITPKSQLSSHAAFPQFVDRPAAAANASSSQKSTRSSSSRVRKPLPNGDGHVIVYSSGVEKEVHKDGTTVIRFNNGDVETNFGTTVAYFHAAEQVLQVANSHDGSVLLEYPSGQIERHYANGVKAILFPDGTKAKISADGKVETYQRA